MSLSRLLPLLALTGCSLAPSDGTSTSANITGQSLTSAADCAPTTIGAFALYASEDGSTYYYAPTTFAVGNVSTYTIVEPLDLPNSPLVKQYPITFDLALETPQADIDAMTAALAQSAPSARLAPLPVSFDATQLVAMLGSLDLNGQSSPTPAQTALPLSQGGIELTVAFTDPTGVGTSGGAWNVFANLTIHKVGLTQLTLPVTFTCSGGATGSASVQAIASSIDYTCPGVSYIDYSWLFSDIHTMELYAGTSSGSITELVGEAAADGLIVPADATAALLSTIHSAADPLTTFGDGVATIAQADAAGATIAQATLVYVSAVLASAGDTTTDPTVALTCTSTSCPDGNCPSTNCTVAAPEIPSVVSGLLVGPAQLYEIATQLSHDALITSVLPFQP